VDPELQMCLTRADLERKNHLLQPTGDALLDAASGGVGLLSCNCCLTFSLVSTRTPRAFSAKLLPRGWPPACPGTWGCFSQEQERLFPLLNSTRFLSAPFSSLSRSLWTAQENRSSNVLSSVPGLKGCYSLACPYLQD